MDAERQKIAVDTFLQEIALMLLASKPLKDEIRKGADKSRGRILADLKPEHRELYLASRDVIRELCRSLARCGDLNAIAGALQVIQGINDGRVHKLEEIADRIVEEA